MALSFDSLNSTIKCYGVQMSENYKKRGLRVISVGSNPTPPAIKSSFRVLAVLAVNLV
jgi:hypothetical protein